MGLFGSHLTLQLKSAWKVRHRVTCTAVFLFCSRGEGPFRALKGARDLPCPANRKNVFRLLCAVQEACRK